VRPIRSGRLEGLWPPLVVGVAGLVLWELFIDLFGVQEFLLPRPLDVWEALGDDWSVIWEGTKKTAWVALSGLVAGVVLAVVAAFLTTRSKLLSEAVTPLASALAATPIVALAPVYFKWFGSVEPTAKQAVVVSVVLFPVFVSTARGLLEVDETHVELMHTYAAGEWRVLREVRVPNAMPFFLTSLKVAASLAVIAAIVSEYFGGEQGTLGGIITQSAGLTRYDRAWAAVTAASVLGIALFAAVNLLERLLLPWQPARRAA
jgi:NitT/TauT family transport system permease protein